MTIRHVDLPCFPDLPAERHDLTTMKGVAVNPGQVDGRPASRMGRFPFNLVCLQSADSAGKRTGFNLNFVADVEAATCQRSSNDCAESC